MAKAQNRARRRQAGRESSPPPAWRGRLLYLVVGAVLIALVLFIALSNGSQGERQTVTRDPELIAAGENLFQANCAACHGADLMGTATGPPLLHSIYAPNHHADEAFQRAVIAGVVPHHWNFGTMAPVPGLSRDDVASIVAFVRTEQEAAGIFRDPSHP